MFARIALAVSAVALFAATNAVADDGHALYRRAVLGDTSVTVPVRATAPAPAYGPYAAYRIHQGATPAAALAEARAIGEQAPAPAPQQALAPLSGYDAYRLAVLGHARADIAAAPARAELAQAAQARR